MDWNALIEETARRSGVSQSAAKQTLDSFFDAIIERMETDEVIQLRPDFGCFEIRDAGGIKCPQEAQLRKSWRTPVFKKSRDLKKHLRQDDEDYLQTLRAADRVEQAERLERARRADRGG